MILNFLFSVVSTLINIIVNISHFLAGGLSVWPDNLLNGLTYFFTSLMRVDFILNTSTLLSAILFFINFEAIFFLVKLLFKFFNWVRGSGGIEI